MAKRNRRFEDISQRRFGRLVVLERTLEQTANGSHLWLCQCDCGKLHKALSGNLRHGNTTSCGCLHAEVTSARSKTHGMRHSPEYYVWAHMIARCTNPRDADFHLYGGRGIVVCDEWRNDFAVFFNDMGPRPKGQSIDRKDCDGPYCKSNCRWATQTQQQNNRRNNRRIIYQGQEMTLREAYDRSGTKLSYRTIRARIFQNGWDVEYALTTGLHP